MLRSLRVLLEKEFLQIRRDPVILRMLLVMPMIQLIILANAATFEVKSSNLWVVDQDRTPASIGLVERFVATGRFVVVGRSAISRPADRAMDHADADAILVIPEGFARDVQRTRHAQVQLVLNAENGSQAGVTQGYGAELIARYAAELSAASAVGGVAGSTGALVPRSGAERAPVRGVPVIETQARGWFNPSLNYKHFMVPGILVQLVVLVGTLMTALNIVREKEAGTLEQLNVTPIRPAVFIAAKLIPLWVIGLFEFGVGLVIATQLFGVPFEGSIALLFAGAGLFLLGALGVGLWISTLAETQQQALFITFSLLMIYILMSGLFTPVRGMPEWVRMIAQLNPMMHFIAMTRAVMLRGAGVEEVARQLLALAVIGVGILTLAISQYRKQAA
jgi:ABC-2 type transport system permease protein